MGTNKKIPVDIALLKKYDKAGPRYTSYPTAPYFHEGVDDKVFVSHIHNPLTGNTNKDLSLYFHIPFCDTLCYFCGCNMMVTRNQGKIEQYLTYLEKEIILLKQHLGDDRKVIQLHWGGGTPTHLSPDQIRRLGAVIHKYFDFQPNAEVGVEIDPRELTRDHMAALSEVGFNRCSMGIQDFDEQVQKAVNRIQPESITRDAVTWAHELGFKSINLDLMYGLPHQNYKTYSETIDKVVRMNPDRLAVFNYAHLPNMIKHQQLINEAWLPSGDQKLELLKLSIEKLNDMGYVYIGMDHFAKPNDELTIAMQNGTLYRNFQGYSTHAGIDLFAIGITGIGMLSDLYVQNFKKFEDYYKALDAGKLPIMRGVALNPDDLLRREVITELMCNFRLSMAKFEQKYGIVFENYFAEALEQLRSLASDELIEIKTGQLRVTDTGRLLIRNIVMHFDFYLMKKQGEKPQFSRTV
ncbi:MAG: oxygen-independent coproporphyrinogen III oxidase [Cyclobacteriaceae bacterium]|nr:oxygen-independent coproporphyrinogen III oxidase [Cyclobacteriaceae bacterium]